MLGSYFNFLDSVPDSSLLYQAEYSVPLVILSISIAVFASYTALLVSRLASQTRNKLTRIVLIIFGGMTLGIGIWSMHFIGMLGFSIPCGISYDPFITAVSIIPGVLAGIFSIYIISLQNNARSFQSNIVGGVIFGGGIGVMHYSGMAAMRMDAWLRYDLALFLVSILVAVLLGTIALWIRNGINTLIPDLKKYSLFISSCVMGAAVSGMHYTAMAAAYFLIGDVNQTAQVDNGFEPTNLAIIVSSVTGVLIGSVLLYVHNQLARRIEQINEELTQANNQLKFQKVALDNHAIVSIANIDGDITYVNDKLIEASGYNRKELIGKNHRIFKSDEHEDDYFKLMWKSITQGEIWQGEINNLSKDGSTKWFNSTIVPFLDPETKTPYQYVAVRTDISKNKESEKELEIRKKEAEAQVEESIALQKLLQTSIESQNLEDYLQSSLSIIMDEISWLNVENKGGIFLNEEQGNGNTLRLIVSQNLSEQLLTLCDQIPFGHCLCGRAATEKKIQVASCMDARHDVTFEGIVDHGHYNVPLLENDKVLGVLVLYLPAHSLNIENKLSYLENIADILGLGISRHYAHQSQLAALDKAKAADKSKSNFLATMSHEIRTPMNGIIGMTHLALETQLNDEQKDYIDKANSSAKQLLGIINDILDFSKIEAGKVDLEYIQFFITKVIADVNNLVTFKAEENGILLKIDLSNDIPNSLIGDPLRIAQILTNLINNAIKFSHSGDEVTLTVNIESTTKNEIVLHFIIQDTGIGISLEKQKRLFKPFSQTDTSSTRKYGGTGLGLVISKNLVEMMDGKIWLDSQEGIGSTFHFTIPFKFMNEELMTSSDADSQLEFDQAIAKLKDKTVLLVEDNKVNQLFAKKLLSKQSIIVDLAEHGQEALDKLEQSHYDLVLMDCMMPIMDGYDATKIIRQSEKLKNIPVIAMTANAMKQDVEKVLEVGMNDHIAKPINPETMFTTMGKWIK